MESSLLDEDTVADLVVRRLATLRHQGSRLFSKAAVCWRQSVVVNRRAVTRRQAIAARVLSGHAWRGERFAYHGWLALPAGWSSAELVAQARRARVAVTPGDAFAVSGRYDPPCVRLSLTAIPDRESLENALERLVRLLELGPRESATVL
jgi:DNA-binding transcriptional MocR family regulator